MTFDFDDNEHAPDEEFTLRDRRILGLNPHDPATVAACRADVLEILSHARAEAPLILAALREGRVDGNHYYGECSCLLGTIAWARNCTFDQLGGIRPNSARPGERWFIQIRPGATPATSPASALAALWVEEFIESNPEIA